MRREAEEWSRREFLERLGLAGTAGLLRLSPEPAAAEPPPETTTVKLPLLQPVVLCWAPLYMAEEFFRHEGFSDIQYVKIGRTLDVEKGLASGQVQVALGLTARHVIRVDAGDPIVMLAGIHVGCYELFGTDRVRAIRDLKGKTVAVVTLGSGAHVFLASMLAHVGLDPRKDINWVTHPADESMRLFAEGKIDAYMAVPPESQDLRAKKIGYVVVNTMMDRPWSQYFCCLVAANREFVRTTTRSRR